MTGFRTSPPPPPPPAVMLPCAVIEQLQRARQARRGKRAESSKRQPPSPPSPPPPLPPRPPRHRAQSASSMPRPLLTLPSRVRGGGGGCCGSRIHRGSDGLRCEPSPDTACCMLYSPLISARFSIYSLLSFGYLLLDRHSEAPRV